MSSSFHSFISRFVRVGLVLLIFGAGMTSGFLVRPATAAGPRPAQFDLFWEVWDLVHEQFVDQDKVDSTAMTYGAIQGMLSTLGDEGHTTFLTPTEAREHEVSLESSYEGIGAYVSVDEGVIRITSPIDGSPAARAGLLPGDVVMAVDGIDVTGESLTEVISRIRGPVGTTVVLTIQRQNAGGRLAIPITRDRIDRVNVDWGVIPGSRLAYLQINQFSAETSRDLAGALWQIRQTRIKGQAIEGIVLDLRNNPGGLLREAVWASSQFLPDGQTILQEENGQGRRIAHLSRGRGWGRTTNLVVLINPGTASAAEITAAALKENDRAYLIGETTFGTGTVLHQFDLQDGSAILLGVANWLTPSGQLIKGQGVSPDLTVTQTMDVAMVNSGQLRELAPEQIWVLGDQQFIEALRYLGGAQERIVGEQSILGGEPESVPEGSSPVPRPSGSWS